MKSWLILIDSLLLASITLMENWFLITLTLPMPSPLQHTIPHVSGDVVLLKTLHPDSSPAAIKSIIMTSGTKLISNGNSLFERATPFAYGSGHIQPNRAIDPGLVYDLSIDDTGTSYVLAATIKYCLKDSPISCTDVTITNPSSEPLIVTRRVKNVVPPSTYKASVRAPAGVSVYNKPASLQFSTNDEEKNFKIVLKAKVAGMPKDSVWTVEMVRWQALC
ncbi:Peptidase S8, subtilisin-related [Trema orientale]|uniref:Peptidase S8, subtilisin-related n=1 Tax=Trema orientale TaxID=63057 RepID=A0A2P5FYJ9_TREOI|nr:Peptidase S8, subtilisin-related [Trema orientale]